MLDGAILPTTAIVGALLGESDGIPVGASVISPGHVSSSHRQICSPLLPSQKQRVVGKAPTSTHCLVPKKHVFLVNPQANPSEGGLLLFSHLPKLTTPGMLLISCHHSGKLPSASLDFVGGEEARIGDRVGLGEGAFVGGRFDCDAVGVELGETDGRSVVTSSFEKRTGEADIGAAVSGEPVTVAVIGELDGWLVTLDGQTSSVHCHI